MTEECRVGQDLPDPLFGEVGKAVTGLSYLYLGFDTERNLVFRHPDPEHELTRQLALADARELYDQINANPAAAPILLTANGFVLI